MQLARIAACLCVVAGCGFPRPPHLDGQEDGGVNDDARLIDDATPLPVCAANVALRCDGANLVRCNAEGTAEVSESCAVGCNATELRCNNVIPSNGLATYLDMTASEPDFDLGTSATINTDDGAVVVDGAPVVVTSATLAQGAAPTIRIFIVHSLNTAEVKITGTNANSASYANWGRHR